MPPKEMKSAGKGADVEGMAPTVIGPAQGRWHFVNAGLSRNSTECTWVPSAHPMAI